MNKISIVLFAGFVLVSCGGKSTEENGDEGNAGNVPEGTNEEDGDSGGSDDGGGGGESDCEDDEDNDGEDEDVGIRSEAVIFSMQATKSLSAS